MKRTKSAAHYAERDAARLRGSPRFTGDICRRCGHTEYTSVTGSCLNCNRGAKNRCMARKRAGGERSRSYRRDAPTPAVKIERQPQPKAPNVVAGITMAQLMAGSARR